MTDLRPIGSKTRTLARGADKRVGVEVGRWFMFPVFRKKAFVILFLFTFLFPSLSYGEEPNPQSNEEVPGNPRYRYLSINPGITLEKVTLSIQGKNRDATMVQRDDLGKISWLLDVKSPEYQFNEYFGVNLLLHTSNFYLNRQSIPKIFSNSPSVSNSPDEDSRSSDPNDSGIKNRRVIEDVYTNVEGRYSMLVPIFYLGNPDTFRFGFGIGPAHVKLKGNVDFKDPASNLLLIYSGPSRNEFLNQVSAYQFASGNINPNTDPTLSYLVANLSSGNHLELTAYYLASQGLLRPDLAAVTIFQSGKYNALEALAPSSKKMDTHMN